MTPAFRLSRAAATAVIVGLGISASAPIAHAQKKLPPPPPTTITEASIRGHMEFLAGDAMQGRGSASNDEWRAAAYMGANLRRWGIEPLGDNGGYVKKVDTGRMRASAAPTLTIGDRTLVHGMQMIVQNANRGSVSGPLFRYTSGSTAPDGAFVFVPDGVTVDNAAISKAAAVLMVETPALRASWQLSGASMPTATPAPSPAAASAAGPAGAAPGRGGRGGGIAVLGVRIALDTATHAMIAGLKDGTKLDFHADLEPVYTYNAIGQLKATGPQASEVILLTAHLDHLGNAATGGRCTPIGTDTICNGADDDASGSTAVLELAEAISKGPRPARTVIFAWFGSEESGGGGNGDFLKNSPVPIKDIVANLEFEMIGRQDKAVADDTLWLTGYERSNLGAELAKQGARLVQDPHPDQNFFQRSDNYALAAQGIIAHTVSSFNLHKEYHHADDDIAHIDFPYMTKSIQSMYAPVMWLSNSAFKPTWYDNCQPAPRVRPGAGAAPTTPAAPCRANGK